MQGHCVTLAVKRNYSSNEEMMGESFIHEVFKALYGDEYEYEGWSYDDALKKIKTLVKQSEQN